VNGDAFREVVHDVAHLSLHGGVLSAGSGRFLCDGDFRNGEADQRE